MTWNSRRDIRLGNNAEVEESSHILREENKYQLEMDREQIGRVEFQQNGGEKSFVKQGGVLFKQNEEET